MRPLSKMWFLQVPLFVYQLVKYLDFYGGQYILQRNSNNGIASESNE